MGKDGRARQATDDNIIRRVGFALWITEPTDTHSEYLTLLAFHETVVNAKEFQYYVTHIC